MGTSSKSATKPFSLYWEIQTTLYLGVFFFLAGLGLTIAKHFSQLGHPLIISTLTLGFLSAFVYCFRKAGPYHSEQTTPPHIFFPYILYLGCVLLSLDVSYIETHFHLLGSWWETYLLLSSVLFGVLGYRFDNRLVLAMALATLAAWFGFTLHQFDFNFKDVLRPAALTYATFVILVGALTYRWNVKKHFLDTFLQFGAHFGFIALVSGTIELKLKAFYFYALLLASGAALKWGFQKGRLIYVVFGVLYGYIGLSAVIMAYNRSTLGWYLYFVISPIVIVTLLLTLAKKVKKTV